MPGPPTPGFAGAIPSGEPVDWQDWHASYDRPDSPLARRLALVQKHIGAVLDHAPAGPLAAISVCAGQGHDLIGVLVDHPRRTDVSARLVELDEDNVRAARAAAEAAGLDRLEILVGDASLLDSYTGAIPASLVLLCGVLGNISVADVRQTIATLPQLCAAGASVVWTRHRNPPDLLPDLLAMFAHSGFEVTALDTEPTVAVGTSVLRTPPQSPRAGTKMFDFIGQQALWPHLAPERRAALQALFRPDCTIVELVEAIRALPVGGPPGQSAEAMLREGRGTPAAKHLFLLEVLQARFPATQPRVVHRLHVLDRAHARSIYGDRAEKAVPVDGLHDVHTYLTVLLGGARQPLDATLAGHPWDGSSPLPAVCGPGEDLDAGDDPATDLARLTARLTDPRRVDFVQAVARSALPHPHPHP